VTDRAGEPLDSVRVHFMPEIGQSGEARTSWAITDEDGQYELEYMGSDGRSGAALGWHRVTLQDILGENFRGPGPPPRVRVPPVYMDPASTPLRFEVASGEQTIDMQVDVPAR